MRKTKIVCTIGPASQGRKILSELIRSGMDVARLNFSHGDHLTHMGRLHPLRLYSKPPLQAQTLGPHYPFTQDEKVCRRLLLLWGTQGRLTELPDRGVLDAVLMSEIESSLIRERIVKKRDSIVFVASSAFMGKPNIMRLHKVG